MESKPQKESIKGWHGMACRRSPPSLRQEGQRQTAALLSRCLTSSSSSKEVIAACDLLREILPVNVRTSVLGQVTSSHQAHPQYTTRLVLLNLLSDVTHIHIKHEEAQVDKEEPISKPEYLDDKELMELVRRLEDTSDLSLENLQLEGIKLPTGLLSLALIQSPRLKNLQVSGELCCEVLSHLKNHLAPYLQSLTLHTSCGISVTDQEVVGALLETQGDLSEMAQAIFTNDNCSDFGSVRMGGLRHLSVVSPSVSVGGALILLHALKNLHYFHYTWLCPIAETVLILQKVSPQFNSFFPLQHLDLAIPSKETLQDLVTLCPEVRKIHIERCDPELLSMEVLLGFPKLSALHLRLVSENLLLSAVEAIGDRLKELKVEFQECTCQPFSFESLTAIQKHCPQLKQFELLHVNIEIEESVIREPNFQNSITRMPAFPDLEHLILSGTLRPSVLGRLLHGNTSLRSLSLNVNQDAINDENLTSLLKRNDLFQLDSVCMGAGCLSPSSITSLLSLPSLSSLSLDVKHCPFIPMTTFENMQEQLSKGNYKCVMKNTERED